MSPAALLSQVACAVGRSESIRQIGPYQIPETLGARLSRDCERAEALSYQGAEADARGDYVEGERLRAESLAAEDAAIEQIVEDLLREAPWTR